jgi:hypothetical protein
MLNLVADQLLHSLQGKDNLLPGFKAVSGCYIHAYITEESSFCDLSEQNPVTEPPIFKSIAVSSG